MNRAIETIGGFSRWLHVEGIWRLLPLLVLAAIVAGLAIPVYRCIPDRSRWSEAKANASLLNAAMKLIAAENGGTIPESVYDDQQPVDWAALELNADEFTSDAFSMTDYRITLIDREAGEWEITVTSGDGGPDGGPYRINQASVVLDDAP